MKKIVMSITVSRIFGALLLLLLSPLSALFYIVYTLCITSDIADGYIARKTKTTSNFGALLDSTADLILIAVVLFILIPILNLEFWMLILVLAVISVRIVSFGIGYAKYRTLTLLHTYANKGAGLIMALFPLYYGMLGLTIAFAIIFAAAFISALEELLITIVSKKLDRNITWFLRV